MLSKLEIPISEFCKENVKKYDFVCFALLSGVPPSLKSSLT
jgi:hypothetical protein